MDKLIETVMNFINENTTLLIIICIFLIFVLIGYLIDNSIKTRKLEKSMDQENNNDSVSMTPVVEVPTEPETVSTPEEKPEVEPTPEIETKPEEETNTIDPNTEINLDFRTEEEKAAEETVEEVEEAPTNEISIDPAINDLLLRDFSTEGAKTVDVSEVVKPEEPVIPEEPVVKAEPESVYKNDKKISDIFKKKTDTPVQPAAETPIDVNTELDRILQKLNDAAPTEDSTLDETTDFTNMF